MVSDNLESLLPGGSIVAAAVALLGWFARNSREDRLEWREQLRAERVEHARELAEARDEAEEAKHELAALRAAVALRAYPDRSRR